MTIYERALDFVADGSTLGLGSGRASSAFIEQLGKRVQAGLRVRGVPTSEASAELARKVGVPLVTLDDGMPLAVTVDGADECDPQLNLIKGYGRALVREKIVAAASQKLLILIGPGKEVPKLGSRGKLPVEVVPFALPLCRRWLSDMGFASEPWTVEGRLGVTDNGNHLLDLRIPPLDDSVALEQQLRSVPGVVGTGLFLQMAGLVLVGDDQFRLTAERAR
jgi:ribose 5-phosphate isomerase A